MSWLNLNDSLNSLKGQITTFATDFLTENENNADPQVELSMANEKLKELQNLCSSQELEISNLRKQNEELFAKFVKPPVVTTNVSEPQPSVSGVAGTAAAAVVSTDESWFWDPPDTSSSSSNIAPSERSCHGDHDITDQLQKEISALRIKINELESENLQLKTDRVLNTNTEVISSDSETEIKELKFKIRELEEKNKNLTIESQDQLEQLDKDCQQTTEKLVMLRDALQLDHNKLKEELRIVKEENCKFENNFNDLEKLQEELKAFHLSKDFLIQEKSKLEETLKSVQLKCIDLEKSNKAREDIETKYVKLYEDYDTLKEQLQNKDDVSSYAEHEKEEVSNKNEKLEEFMRSILKIFGESIIKENTIQEAIDNPEKINKILNKVDDYIKDLTSYKWKTQTLEKKICEISNESKVNISNKDKEIENIITESEFQSKKLSQKVDEIKRYEKEISDLNKHNELLINELQIYKNNSGLQTISESNEENILILETQLEAANKKIAELESKFKKEETKCFEEFTIIEQPIAEKLDLEVTDLTSKLEYTQELLDELKKQYDDTLKENEELQKEVSSLKDLKLKNSSISKEVTELKSNFDNTTTMLESETKKNILLEKDIENLKGILNLNSENENDNIIDLTNKLHDAETDLEAKSMEVIRLEEMNVNMNCFIQNIQSENEELKTKYENDMKNVSSIEDKIQNLQFELNNYMKREENLKHEYNKMKIQIEEKDFISEELKILQAQLNKKEEELVSTSLREKELSNRIVEKETIIKSHEERIKNYEIQLEEINTQQKELINSITTKHNENIQYHNEIKRLMQLLSEEKDTNVSLESKINELNKKMIEIENEPKSESTNINNEKITELENEIKLLKEKSNEATLEIEKLTDQNSFLSEKCDIVTKNLLEEQSSIYNFKNNHEGCAETIGNLTKELDRLRHHLLSTEETNTTELVNMEAKCNELRAKIAEMEKRERENATHRTSASIRATQQTETLQAQLTLMVRQRDELTARAAAAEDEKHKMAASITNLQCVLEQFQRDKEKDIIIATDKIKKQIDVERQVQSDLRKEIDLLKSQLADSKQGLQAASRLQEQLEKCRHQNCTLKNEVSTLQSDIEKLEKNYKELTSQTDNKVDKLLIKNLVVGYIASNPNRTKDQDQILRLIATVLNFGKDDNDKVNRQNISGSWIGWLLHPSASSVNVSQQSLSEAFIRFLESESQPKPTPPPLSLLQTPEATGRQTPLLLSDVVLPTFMDLVPNKNQSSILKDVLKDNK